MSQVLEAPELLDETQVTLTLNEGHPAVSPHGRATSSADTHRRPLAALRAILSGFTRPRLHAIPACADTTAQYESALDHICRLDPYFCSKALSG